MFKKIKENWKTYLLAILSLLFGADQAHEFGFIGTAGTDDGKLIRTPDISQPAPDKALYVVTAAFYEVDAIKVGNFPDVTIEDDLGPFTVRVEKPSANYVEAKFKERFPGYSRAKVRLPFHKVIEPKKDKDKDDSQEEETVQKE